MAKTAGKTAEKQQKAAGKPRETKSSFKADVIFAGYLLVFIGCILAQTLGLIPSMSWELYSLPYHAAWMHWLDQNAWIPNAFSIGYVVFVFGMKAYLKDKKGFDEELRLPLAFWSILLAAFSFMGAVRTVPAVLSILEKRGVWHLVCGDTRGEWLAENPAGFWTLLFCLSKIPELGDTVFIVLRKKSLITLHWYHHITVMLFCWHAWATMSLNGIIFAAMNLTVHTVMYGFYAMAAFKMRPNTFDKFITIGQILQMAVGTAVTAYVTMDKIFWHPVELTWSFTPPNWVDKYQFQPDGKECYMSVRASLSGCLMYMSYLLFFVEFFYSAYIARDKKVKEA
jgi:elongation of very long chain fatty acids protein 6